MLKFLLFIPLLLGILIKFFALNIPTFIINFQLNHPVIYKILIYPIFIFYIFSFMFAFIKTDEQYNDDSNTKDNDDSNTGNLGCVTVFLALFPVVVYTMASIFSIGLPWFVVKFQNAFPTFSYVVNILLVFAYLIFVLLCILAAAVDIKYIIPNIAVLYVPLYIYIFHKIFNIQTPDFIKSFIDEHIVVSIISLVLFGISYLVLFVSTLRSSFKILHVSVFSFSALFKSIFYFIFPLVLVFFIYQSDLSKYDSSLVLEDSNSVLVDDNVELIENSNNFLSIITHIFAIIMNYKFIIMIVLGSVIILFLISYGLYYLINYKNMVNLKYEESGSTYLLKGMKNRFIISKDNEHSFLVENGSIVAYKDRNGKFKYYNK